MPGTEPCVRLSSETLIRRSFTNLSSPANVGTVPMFPDQCQILEGRYPIRIDDFRVVSAERGSMLTRQNLDSYFIRMDVDQLGHRRT
jgi:hypothetical protein